MFSVPNRARYFLSPRVRIADNTTKVLSDMMGVPYVETISVRGVQLNLNSNERCNRFLIYEYFTVVGVQFPPDTSFEDDVLRFTHNAFNFRLDFDDVDQSVSLKFRECLWTENVSYRNLQFHIQFDNTGALNALDPTNDTLTEANTLIANLHYRF